MAGNPVAFLTNGNLIYRLLLKFELLCNMYLKLENKGYIMYLEGYLQLNGTQVGVTALKLSYFGFINYYKNGLSCPGYFRTLKVTPPLITRLCVERLNNSNMAPKKVG